MEKKSEKTYRQYAVGFQKDALERMKHCDDIRALAAELGVSRGVLYLWKRKSEGLRAYGKGPAEAPDEAARKIQQLEAEVASLEGELGRYGKLESGTRAGILVLSTADNSLRMPDPDGLSRNDYRWNPDSKRLLSVHKVDGDENEMYYTQVDSGSPQPTGIRMTGLAYPSLNADGTKLLFGSATSKNELWVLRNLPLGGVAKSR
jgi:hypothetical protein